jgi:hypothetical protein
LRFQFRGAEFFGKKTSVDTDDRRGMGDIGEITQAQRRGWTGWSGGIRCAAAGGGKHKRTDRYERGEDSSESGWASGHDGRVLAGESARRDVDAVWMPTVRPRARLMKDWAGQAGIQIMLRVRP